MRLTKSVFILVFFAIATLPISATTHQEKNEKLSEPELIHKCALSACEYINGDKTSAQKLAKELLPEVEKICHDSDPRSQQVRSYQYYDFAAALNMLKAVVGDNSKPIENYMLINYWHDKESELTDCPADQEPSASGFRVGIQPALDLDKRELILTGAEPLYGSLSMHYLALGNTVVRMIHHAGQNDDAKSLAKQLLPWWSQIKTLKGVPQADISKFKDDNEAYLKGLLNDDQNVFKPGKNVLFACPQATNLSGELFKNVQWDDSIGRRLERAYGHIYLYKRLRMNFDHLAYAYNELGRAQAIAGNYDESERAYETALQLAKAQYSADYPEILLYIRSEYAAMLKVSGKTDEAAKMAEGVTPQYLEEVMTKAHPDRKPNLIYGSPQGWGP